jgi:hypothetical protein
MPRPLLTASARWRQVFKCFNQFMLLMWRLGLGSISDGELQHLAAGYRLVGVRLADPAPPA